MLQRSSSSVRIFYPRFSREQVVERITQNLGKLQKKLPLLLVALFGSYARGDHTVASDIDLLVIYGGEKTKGHAASSRRQLTY